MRDVKFGAPGFILMDEMRKDMRGTLKKIGALGYDGIELLGFFGHKAAEIRCWCAEAGLEPYGCFLPINDLAGPTEVKDPAALSPFDAALLTPGCTPEEKLQFVQAIGCRYVTLLLPDDMPVTEAAEKYNRIVETARPYGIRLQYHNHAQEYLNRTEDGYRMDELLRLLHPDVLFQPDLGWMEIGGCRCPEQIRRYARRVQIVHLKDYYREQFDTALDFRFRPVGYGVMNWGEILPLCETLIQPLWYTADHDTAYDGDLYEELALCLHFMKNALRYC